MPTHVYIPPRTPPRWYDRVMVHPFDNAVGMLCFLFGLLMVAALSSGGAYNPSSSMMRLPAHIGFITSSCLMVGGVMALTGLHWIGETVSRGWHIERTGWLAITAGLAGYAIAVAWHFTASTTSWLIPAILALAAFLRFLSLIFIERNTRRTLVEVREESRGT